MTFVKNTASSDKDVSETKDFFLLKHQSYWLFSRLALAKPSH